MLYNKGGLLSLHLHDYVCYDVHHVVHGYASLFSFSNNFLAFIWNLYFFCRFFYISSWYKCNKNSVCYLWNSFNQLLKCCVYPSPKLRHRKRGLDFLIWVSDHVTIISMQIRITHADHDKVAEYGTQSYRWHGFQSIFGPKPVKDDTYTAQCICD